MSAHVAYALFLIFVCAQSLCAKTGTRPDTTELTLVGLDLEAGPTDIVRVLGRPDSVRTYEHPNDVGSEYDRFFYRNVTVFMGPDGPKLGVKLNGPGVTTRRGLAFGDSVERALELYGPPDTRSQTQLVWRIAGQSASDKPELVVEVRGGRVASIYAGYESEGLRMLPNRPLVCARSQAPVTLRSTDKVAPAARGTATLTPAQDSGGLVAFDVSVTVRDLPAVAALGAYSAYVLWVSTLSLEHFRSLGAIENGKSLTARVNFPNVLFLVSSEPGVTGDRWTGPIVMAGRCP
ncbi:MAG: hypothetical protein WD825_04395 [Gemmatimonadaceae bacterium]